MLTNLFAKHLHEKSKTPDLSFFFPRSEKAKHRLELHLGSNWTWMRAEGFFMGVAYADLLLLSCLLGVVLLQQFVYYSGLLTQKAKQNLQANWKAEKRED